MRQIVMLLHNGETIHSDEYEVDDDDVEPMWMLSGCIITSKDTNKVLELIDIHKLSLDDIKSWKVEPIDDQRAL